MASEAGARRLLSPSPKAKAVGQHQGTRAQAYVKACLLQSLPSAHRPLRAVAGTAVSGVVVASGLADWPELVARLVCYLALT